MIGSAHHDFLRLDFIKQCVTGRDLDDRLFPELNNNNLYKRFGDSVGKKFPRLLASAGIELNDDNSDGGLHRFRHTFITTLTNLNANPAYLDDITGHSSGDRSSERPRYTKEIWLKNKKATIDLLKLPIDIDMLNDRYEKELLDLDQN